MSVTTLLALSALAVGATHHKKHGRDFTRDFIKSDVFKAKKSIPYWTDKPRKLRGDVPYPPPKDWIYNTKGGPKEGMINVHLVPHSHDDPGWQVSVDQYFFEQVYYIVDTLLMRLTEDENRRFMFVETSFFARWWQVQPPKKQAQLKTLVTNGQLEFVNGGWCMHDEASPYYVEMVDQTTRGHQFLLSNFGEAGRPKGSWTIDPFGHSNTNAWLIGAESGMDYLFWGRMDYQDFAMRKPTQKLEWIWEGSETMGDTAQIFAGQLFGRGAGGYGTWTSYDNRNAVLGYQNENDNGGRQVQDDPRLHDYNVDQVVDQFVQNARTQAASFRTDHQMWACGDDFNYQNADHWYRNLDKTIHYVNLNGTVNVFYSTPTLYVAEKKKADLTWEVRKDDIFPLGDAAHHYWSGYFTSRPSLKRQVHAASNFLNAARQMEVISKVNKTEIKVATTRASPEVGASWTDSLEGSIGVATHHDGMSGTERQDVSNDYSERISESHGEVEDGVALAFNKLMGTSVEFQHCNCNSMGADNCLNISMCATTTDEAEFTVAAWNPLARGSVQGIRLPVTFSFGTQWKVYDHLKRLLPSDLVEIDARTHQIPLLYLNSFGLTTSQEIDALKNLQNKATHVLSFTASLPPLGFAKFHAVRTEETKVVPKPKKVKADEVKLGESLTISNDMYELQFDTERGLTTILTNKETGASTPFSVTTGWYNSSVGGCTLGMPTDTGCDDQRSGAYMFRPNSTKLFYPGPTQVPTLKVVYGEQVDEVYQTFSTWVTCVYRLWKTQKNLEVEWTAGPIPIDTPWLPGDVYPGKEVVFRYSTGMNTGGTFYTDANGREMVKRQFNARGPSYPTLAVNEPVAGNYYPVNGMISVQDQENQLTVLTDVTQGGASLEDGAVELMVHRRLQYDDSRGVQEPLNETMCGCNDINAGEGQMGEHGQEGDGGCLCKGLAVRGRHLVIFDIIDRANSQRRQDLEELAFPATLAFAKGDIEPKSTFASFINGQLPKQVKLMTLNSNYATLNGGKTLLRIAHLYQANESVLDSVPVAVDFTKIFSHSSLKIKSMEETQLTGTMPLAEMDSSKFKWKTYTPNEGVAAQFRNSRGFTRSYLNLNDFTVTIKPMEVRTYLVTFH